MRERRQHRLAECGDDGQHAHRLVSHGHRAIRAAFMPPVGAAVGIGPHTAIDAGQRGLDLGKAVPHGASGIACDGFGKFLRSLAQRPGQAANRIYPRGEGLAGPSGIGRAR